MITKEFKNFAEYYDWAKNEDILNIEIIGKLIDPPSDFFFTLDLEDGQHLMIQIEREANTDVFVSMYEFEKWISTNQPNDIVNNGLSDVLQGFNEYECQVNGKRFICYVA